MSKKKTWLPLKITSWVLRVLLGVLILTGFYIERPLFFGGMGLFRFLHLLSGYLILIDLACLAYFWVISEKFNFRLSWLRRLIYLSGLIFTFLLTLTGFSLYFTEVPFFAALNTLSGGLAKMRVFHSLLRWLLMVAIGIYLYLHLLNSLRNRTYAISHSEESPAAAGGDEESLDHSSA